MGDRQDIWLKAAVIGSIWGASEIVLGSFLHNLRIPFSGNILTAIGIVIMVSGHRLWPQTGLLIRAGLICSALKTLSPSPVILGPMLSIFMQAALMETAVYVARKSNAGYIAGGGLAVSWNLAYRILSTIVLYGSSLVALYQNLVDFMADQTNLEITSYWAPIMILWAVFFTWGALAGVIGIHVSRFAGKTQASIAFPPGHTPPVSPALVIGKPNKYMLLRPLGILLLLVAGLYSIHSLPLFYASALLSAFLAFAWVYDRRLILRFIRKKGIWIAFAIMLGLSSFLLGPETGFSTGGLARGVEMLMRAIYVITGFGIISKELQRPGMAGLFGGPRMIPFMEAVRTAFQTTPLIIAGMPEGRAWRNPLRILSTMAGSMEYALEYIRTQNAGLREVVLITGQKGAGKTTLLRETLHLLRDSGWMTAGIIAPAVFENGRRSGYTVEDLASGNTALLCRHEKNRDPSLPGQYRFEQMGLHLGQKALSPPSIQGKDLLVVDELGPYEMDGQGWDTALQSALSSWNGPMAWVVRPSMTETILRKYNARAVHVFYAGKNNAQELARTLDKMIRTSKGKNNE